MGGVRGWTRSSARCVRLAGIALLVVASAVCSDGSAPSVNEETGAREVLALELVNGELRAGDTARYEYRARDANPFVVTLTAQTGPVRLSVLDSTGASVVLQVGAGGQPPYSADVTSSVISPTPSEVYTLVVTGTGAYGMRIIATTPETAAARLVVNDTIRESLDATGDVDVFTFEAAPGELFIGYLQLVNGGGTTATLEVRGNGYDIAWPSKAGTNELEAQATDRFASTVADTVRVTIRGDYVGPYRLMIRRIDRGPETARARTTPNDTLETERLDYVGDVDEFTISGTPGAPYTVMLQLTNGDSAQRARLEVWHAGDRLDPVASTFSAGNSPSLASGAAGRFLLEESGSATIIIRAIGTARGPYRLLVYRIDTLPEHVASRLSPTDSLIGEDLELPGDIDDFAIDLPRDDTLQIIIRYDSATPPVPNMLRGVSMTLVNSVGELVASSFLDDWTWGATGSVPLPSGRYRLRVATFDEPLARAVGPYSISAYRLSGAPEERAAAFAVGDTVAGIIDPAGDVDEYRFQGQKGDHIDLEMQDRDGHGALTATITKVGGPGVASVESRPTLSEPTLYRVTLPETGTYLLRAQSSRRGQVIDERGAYRMLVRRVSGAPEHHAAELALGDTVSDEGIETPGDVDEFFVLGTPGSEFTAQFNAGDDQYGLDLQLVDATTKDVLQYISNVGTYGSFSPFGRLTFPASGRLMLRVQERGGQQQVARTVPYTILLFAINRAPETLPVRFAIGDTVSGESISPIEDIDEFEFTGTQGERLLALVTTAVGTAKNLAFQVFEATSGRLVAAARVDHPQWELGPDRSQVFTLPSSGTYLVRVQWPFEGTGAYKFLIQRQ